MRGAARTAATGPLTLRGVTVLAAVAVFAVGACGRGPRAAESAGGAPASARDGDAGARSAHPAPPSSPPACPDPERPPPAPPASHPRAWSRQGTARGEVLRLAFGAGVVTLRSLGARRVLHATPDVLRMLSPGQVVTLAYGVVGGRAWVELPRDGSPFAPWSIRGTLAGPVARVDRARGVVTIGDVVLRSHPARLVGVAPGERVVIDFARVDGANWLLSLAAAPPAVDRAAPPSHARGGRGVPAE